MVMVVVAVAVVGAVGGEAVSRVWEGLAHDECRPFPLVIINSKCSSKYNVCIAIYCTQQA